MADNKPLPLAAEWESRRKLKIRGLAGIAKTVLMIGGTPQEATTKINSDWVSIDTNIMLADSVHLGTSADSVWFWQVGQHYGATARTRSVPGEGGAYNLVVEYLTVGGETATHWYYFAPITEKEIEECRLTLDSPLLRRTSYKAESTPRLRPPGSRSNKKLRARS